MKNLQGDSKHIELSEHKDLRGQKKTLFSLKELSKLKN